MVLLILFCFSRVFLILSPYYSDTLAILFRYSSHTLVTQFPRISSTDLFNLFNGPLQVLVACRLDGHLLWAVCRDITSMICQMLVIDTSKKYDKQTRERKDKIFHHRRHHSLMIYLQK